MVSTTNQLNLPQRVFVKATRVAKEYDSKLMDTGNVGVVMILYYCSRMLVHVVLLTRPQSTKTYTEEV
jgi:hypothetical protein